MSGRREGIQPGWLGLVLVALVVFGALAATPGRAQTWSVSQGTSCSGGLCTSIVPGAALPISVMLQNGQDSVASVTGSVTGGPVTYSVPDTGTAAGYLPFVSFLGLGAANEENFNPPPAAQGPSISLSANVTVTETNIPLSPETGILTALSFGARGAGWAEKNYCCNTYIYDGGDGGAVALTLAGGSLTAQSQGPASPPLPAGSWPAPMVIGLAAISRAGDGTAIDTKNDCCAGDGGDGGPVSVTTGSGTAITIGNAFGNASTAGIAAVSTGGAPGALFISNEYGALIGEAGNGGSVNVSHGGAITNNAANSFGILALSAGADGADLSGYFSGAGSAGPVSVALAGDGTGNAAEIAMTGPNSIGLFAASLAGVYNPTGETGDQTGGPVDVMLAPGTAITATGGGRFSLGVLAISTGSESVIAPTASSGSLTAPGVGGAGTVSVLNQGSIATSGELALGIGAFSVGGAGIITNVSGNGYLGNSNTPSTTRHGDVGVANTGTLATTGASAFGIVATSAGNGGGLLGIDSVTQVIIGANTSDTTGHPAGNVVVANTGTLTTGDGAGGGTLAIGIAAQSIGGGGGSAGGNGVAAFVGDAGGGGGDGGSVAVVSGGGQITTLDDGALGVLAQSVGGGGGNGGNAAGLFVAVGGQGGNGGSGGDVAVVLAPDGSATTAALDDLLSAYATNNRDSKDSTAGQTFIDAMTAYFTGGTAAVSGTADPSGGIVTEGDFAAGVVAHSVGGGGGSGGFADSVGVFFSAGIGGAAGGGGDGGAVSLVNDQIIATSGVQSMAVLAQSIGGGGGTGGATNSVSVGAILDVGLTVGGSGGSGGSGGAVAIANGGQIVTTGRDSIGVIAHSIGGGGGNGGAATDKTLAVGVPLVDDIGSLSFSASIGGSGGGGGSGGNVTVDNVGGIATAGNGSHGVLAQSISGGGGNGGDSSATALLFEYATAGAKLAFSLGGSGASGGYAGEVAIGNGAATACVPCTGSIVTTGQNAVGVLAQSIGGGGGNGALGNASTSSQDTGLDAGYNIGITLGLGGSAGGASFGGAVTVTNEAGSTIATAGSGSHGVLAQSIGGGGGNAGGGSSGGSGDNLDVNIAVGNSGGGGGSGGTVSVTNAGTLATAGGEAIGILAQSIGGGGGAGGSSDAAASIGDAAQIEDQVNPPANSYTAEISVGGSGGGGGNGGAIWVTNSGTLATSGVRAYGVLAQSIGAGGGSGGAATSAANSVLGGLTPDGKDTKSGTYAATLSVGGSGSVAGNGGTLTLDSPGSVLTAGYGAHGLFVQSIGGGGGVGAEGTVNNTTTIGIGAGASGGSGAGGSGGQVTVTAGDVTTLGNDAFGLLAQSIGGGGGAASASCSNSTSASAQGVSATRCFGNTGSGVDGSVAPWNDATSIVASVGGNAGASGTSGNVTVTANGAIVTTGARSVGLAAQSIGGGGGLVVASALNLAGTPLQAAPGQNTGNADNATVTLSGTGSITTSGAGAWGILAQSIGGGGGVDGDLSLSLMAMPASNTLPGLNPSSTQNDQYPDSGWVSVTSAGTITTTGANAHGIVAQAIGGGGGIAGGDSQSPDATLVMGNSAAIYSIGGESYSGIGRGVTVTQTGGAIRTTGAGSIAILAQSSGNADYTSPIDITIGGTVTGGTSTGAKGIGAAGILVSGGASASSGSANTIQVTAGGSVGTVDGVAGTAILSGYGLTNVVTAGTLTGSVNLADSPGATAGTLTNMAGGQMNTGASLVTATLSNAGTVAVGGSGAVGTTALAGDFSQTSPGALAVDIDATAPQTADLLTVSGSADIGGTIVPTATALLPGVYQVATAASLSSTATVPASYLFTWNLTPTATSLSLSPEATLAPGDAGLSANGQALAGYLQSAWDAGGTPGFAPLFGALSGVSSAAAYGSTLDTLLQGVGSHGKDQILASGQALSSELSCPVFDGATTLLAESSCAWSKMTGTGVHSDTSATADGYDVRTLNFRLGAQIEVAPDWALGSTLAYTRSWTSFDNVDASSTGHTVDGGLALKRTLGPWYLAGALNGAYSWYDDRRSIGSGTLAGTVTSQPDVLTLAGRLRAAYELAFDRWYLRPHVDLDLIYASAPGYAEQGPSAFALDVQSQSQTLFSAALMAEAGGRIDLPRDWILRPYAVAGVTWLSDDRWTSTATMQGAPAGLAPFDIASDLPQVVGRLEAGLQLYQRDAFEAKIDASLAAGDGYLAHAGSVRIGYHF